MELDDARSFVLQAKSLEQPDDLPDWQVFTPDGDVLVAGPGPVWSAVPADVPLDELPDPLLEPGSGLRRLAARSMRKLAGNGSPHGVARELVLLALLVTALGADVVPAIDDAHWSRVLIGAALVWLIASFAAGTRAGRLSDDDEPHERSAKPPVHSP